MGLKDGVVNPTVDGAWLDKVYLSLRTARMGWPLASLPGERLRLGNLLGAIVAHCQPSTRPTAG